MDSIILKKTVSKTFFIHQCAYICFFNEESVLPTQGLSF